MEDFPAQLTQIINTIDSAVLILTVKVFLAILLGIILKNIAQNIFSYFDFRSNKYVCIGRKVVVDSFEGVITSITPRFVIIENKEQSLLLPTTKWREYNWKFYHNIDRQDSITLSHF